MILKNTSRAGSKPDYVIAEEMVRTITGGKLTPGSGNKGIKGDVILPNWMFECKQTAGEQMSLQKEWLTRLEIHKNKKDLCLVIFFELRGYPYYFEASIHSEDISWKTKQLKESNLPEMLFTSGGIWKLDDWDSLGDLG